LVLRHIICIEQLPGFIVALSCTYPDERNYIMSLRKYISQLTSATVIACSAMTAAHAANDPMEKPAGASTAMSDSVITTKVKATLISNKLSAVSVTTELGVVALSGSVESEELRQKATKIAAAVEGVRGVEYKDLSVKKVIP
jgi:osmotically-inducible protein OsmY